MSEYAILVAIAIPCFSFVFNYIYGFETLEVNMKKDDIYRIKTKEVDGVFVTADAYNFLSAERDRLLEVVGVYEEALLWSYAFLAARDEMNAKVHCSPIRLSPLTERVKYALEAGKKAKNE